MKSFHFFKQLSPNIAAKIAHFLSVTHLADWDQVDIQTHLMLENSLIDQITLRLNGRPIHEFLTWLYQYAPYHYARLQMLEPKTSRYRKVVLYALEQIALSQQKNLSNLLNQFISYKLPNLAIYHLFHPLSDSVPLDDSELQSKLKKIQETALSYCEPYNINFTKHQAIQNVLDKIQAVEVLYYLWDITKNKTIASENHPFFENFLSQHNLHQYSLQQLKHFYMAFFLLNRKIYPIKAGMKEILNTLTYKISTNPNDDQSIQQLIEDIQEKLVRYKIFKHVTFILSLTHMGINQISINLFDNISLKNYWANLTILDISNNFIQQLPEHIGSLSELNILCCFNNSLMYLPDSIGKLNKLITLNVNDNQLGQLPQSLGELPNLVFLSCIGNQIFKLPNNIIQRSTPLIELLRNNLPSIEFRSLGQQSNPCDWQSARFVVKALHQYTHLNHLQKNPMMISCDGRLINTLPFNEQEHATIRLTVKYLNEGTSGLRYQRYNSRLELLDLSGLGLTQIPESVFFSEVNPKFLYSPWGKLKALNLSNNQLTQLPQTLEELPALIEIDYSNNPIKTIPQNLMNRQSMWHKIKEACNQKCYYLDLSGLDLTRIFETALTEPFLEEYWSKLTGLNISNNKLTKLPLELGTLFNLNILDCSKNKIKQLPTNIAYLTNLQLLDCSYNQLKHLPSIGFPELKKLCWRYNLFTQLPDNLARFQHQEWPSSNQVIPR